MKISSISWFCFKCLYCTGVGFFFPTRHFELWQCFNVCKHHVFLSRLDENFVHIVSILNSLWKDNFVSEVWFYVVNSVKVFSSSMHSVFYNVRNMFLDKFLKLLMPKVLLGGKIVKTTFNERLILVKFEKKK